MSTTTRPGAPAPSAGAADGVGAGSALDAPRRRAPGRLLVAAGSVVAAAMVVGTTLTLLGLLVRQEDVARASYDGVGAVRVDASCAGDVGVVADPSVAPGTAQVVWRERWSLLRPSHDGAVRGGTLGLGTTCSPVTVGISSVSDVSVRVPPGLAVSVDSGLGDVAVSGTGTGVQASTGTGDVRVDGAAGTVAVDSGVGDVTVDGSLVRVRVSAGTGDVRVTSSVPPDLVAVDAGVGDVTVRLPAGEGAYAVDTDAGVGGTTLGVPRDPASPRRVRVGSGVGDITVEALP